MMERKIISDLLDIIRFKFKDISNYNYSIYILIVIFILFVFIDSANFSKIFTIGSNYKLIIFIFCINFFQLIFLSLLLTPKNFEFNKFKEVVGFILLTFVILIPAKFFNILNININIKNFITIFSYITYIWVYLRGALFILNINSIKLIIKSILGFYIFPIILLSLVLLISNSFGFIQLEDIKINGENFDDILKIKLKDFNNGNNTQ